MALASTGRHLQEITERENLFQAKHTLLRKEGRQSSTERQSLAPLGIEQEVMGLTYLRVKIVDRNQCYRCRVHPTLQLATTIGQRVMMKMTRLAH